MSVIVAVVNWLQNGVASALPSRIIARKQLSSLHGCGITISGCTGEGVGENSELIEVEVALKPGKHEQAELIPETGSGEHMEA